MTDLNKLPKISPRRLDKMPAEPYYHSQTFFTLVIYLMIATMTFKVFTLLVFLFALLGFSGVSQAQDYGCIMSPKKCNINGVSVIDQIEC